MYRQIITILLIGAFNTILGQTQEKHALQGNQAYDEGMELMQEAQELGKDTTRIKQAQAKMADAHKSFTEAEVRYKKAIKTKDKKYLEAEFNLGDALFKQGRYDDARAKFQSIIDDPKTPPIIKGYAQYNIGNAHLQEFMQDPQENKDKIDESIEAYKQALRMNPKDTNARYNLEFARKLKQQQEQQEQQQQENQDQDENKEQEQEQKQDENKEQEQEQKKDKNKDQQDENQKKDNKQDQKKEQEQEQKDEISKEEAERLLKALENKEEELQEDRKGQKIKGGRVIIEKDW